MTLLITYFCCAIAVSFLCSILEAVLLSITPSFVEARLQNNPTQGGALFAVRAKLDDSISCILILNTFAHTMGAAGVGSQAVQIFGAKWESLIAVVLTLAILYLSEIIPKTLGATYWRSLAVPSAKTILLLVKLVYPLVWFSTIVTKMFGKGHEHQVGREEIKAFAAIGLKDGVLEQQESQLMGNILALRDITVEQILTPRTVVYALEQNITVKQVFEDEHIQRFSRVPVFDGSIDQITGFVYRRHLHEAQRGGKDDLSLQALAKPIVHVAKDLSVLNLLDLLLSRKDHICVVDDDYGQTAGIATLEDAIETLLGCEIVDETDAEVDMQQLAKKRFKDRINNCKTLVNSDSPE